MAASAVIRVLWSRSRRRWSKSNASGGNGATFGPQRFFESLSQRVSRFIGFFTSEQTMLRPGKLVDAVGGAIHL